MVPGRIIVLVAAFVNLTFLPCPPHVGPSSHFVTRRGQCLLREGRQFRFIGVNCYRLAEYGQQADWIFSTLATHGVKVVRFWAFQKYCGPSGRDFSRFDALVAAAGRHDILLLPVLENHWTDCTYGNIVKPRAWYERGWRRGSFGSAPRSYCNYAREIAAHYRDEPQVVAWQLVNEPEIHPDTDENFKVLQNFAREAAIEIKQMDPNHLVSLGLLGIGQPSTTGGKFRALQNCDSLDLVTAHDHGYIYERLAGRHWRLRQNSFYADLCDARSLAKPFVATESGIALPWVNGDREQRSRLFREKLNAFFASGGSGYILWNFEPECDTEFGFDAADPVMRTLAETAQGLSS